MILRSHVLRVVCSLTYYYGVYIFFFVDRVYLRTENMFILRGRRQITTHINPRLTQLCGERYIYDNDALSTQSSLDALWPLIHNNTTVYKSWQQYDEDSRRDYVVVIDWFGFTDGREEEEKKETSSAGLEPTISSFEGKRLIH